MDKVNIINKKILLIQHYTLKKKANQSKKWIILHNSQVFDKVNIITQNNLLIKKADQNKEFVLNCCFLCKNVEL